MMSDGTDLEIVSNSSGLICDVQKKLSSNGSSIEVSKDLNEAKEALIKARMKYLSNYIVLEEIKDFVQSKKATDDIDLQYISTINDALTRAQLKQIVIFPCGSGNEEVRILGINKEEICLHGKKKQNIHQALQQFYIPELEKAFKEKCKFLYEFFSPVGSNSSDALIFSKACQLPIVVENQLQKMVGLKESLVVKRKENWKRLQNYFKALCLELKLTRDLLSYEEFRSSHSNSEVKVNWLAAKCEALHLKLNVIRTQILSETYNSESVEALKRVREHLLNAMEDGERKLERSRESLLVYQSTGAELEALAKEFAQITTEIDNKKWALSQLQHSIEKSYSVDV